MTSVSTEQTGATGPAASERSQAERPPVTLRTIARFVEQGERFACLTCYDFTTAKWLERAGVPVLLVGDTAAEMILGLPGTIHAPLDFLITLNAAVKRGAPRTLVIGDMPFMSYQADDAEGLRNAARFMTEGRADIVKVEVDRSFTPLIEKMHRAGVPVIAHIGMRPQRAKLRGGYRSVGRTASSAQAVVDDAVALEAAGATMLLIEASPNEVAQRVLEETSVPVIGCGAGPACHGQIVVLQDILGQTDWQPSFARPIAALGEEIQRTAARWVAMVRDGELGDHPYKMSAEEAKKLSVDAVPNHTVPLNT